MKIWHISDTHGYHDLLKIPEGIDLVIHSGDAGNSRDIYRSEREILDFWMWFEQLPMKYKVFIPGNHDSFLESSTSKEFKNSLKENEFILINELIEIEGIKIWGSPYCPTYGKWSFMKARAKLHRLWSIIPDNVDVVVTHTPPKGALDLAYGYSHNLEYCGCNALKKRIIKINPALHLFGHIHTSKEIINAGTLQYSFRDTIYSNGSVLTDGKFGKLSSNGNLLTIKNN